MIEAALLFAFVVSPPEIETVKIPGTVTSFQIVKVPDGVGPDGKPIKDLWVGETEITWDVFDIWAFRLDQTPDERAKGLEARSRPSKPYGAPDRGFGHAGYAAIGMTYPAAKLFCDWLRTKTGLRFRIPTESEWEYVAKAGSDAPVDVLKSAWVWENSDDQAQPVKNRQPNAWGLYDTLGNMAEWAIRADDRSVVCGGSWRDKAEKVNVATRAFYSIAWQQNDPQTPKSRWWLSNADFVGLRVVCVK